MNRYIKTVIIKNFQSYKEETIHLEPGLNLILGTSDSGKSAVLRAISFVLYNYPKKDSLIHWGETETSVSLIFSDGVKVTRIKGSDRNAIEAVDASGKKISKEKIDTEIPEEIRELLGHPPQDELNGLISYSDQFSKMFLVDLSPTDLPRSLSNLTGIEVLEESAKQLLQSYKSVEKQNKLDEKEYKTCLEEAQAYSYVELYEKKIKNLSNSLDYIAELENKLEFLDKMIDGIDLDINEGDTDVYTTIITSIDQAITRVKSIEKLIEKEEKLQLFSLFADEINSDDIQSIDICLKNIDNVLGEIQQHSEKIVLVEKLTATENVMSIINENGQSIKKEYDDLKVELAGAEHDAKVLTEFLIEQNIKCDACGSILK